MHGSTMRVNPLRLVEGWRRHDYAVEMLVYAVGWVAVKEFRLQLEDDCCSFFSKLWSWRTVIFQLSGFYCSLNYHTINNTASEL